MTLSRRAFGGLTIGGSAAAMLAACTDEGDSGEGPSEVVWAIDSVWESWNENTVVGNNSAGRQAMTPMAPLTREGYDFDPEGEVFHDDAIFAAGPELVSEAPMQLRMTLNENAQWSDGESIRLEDFLFQWYSRSGNPDHANQEKATPAATAGYESIESIEQEEDGSILFTFVEGYVDPEWQFWGGLYLPSHIAEAEGFDWQNDPEAMGDAVRWFDENLWDVVTGPYVPVDSSLGEFIVYEINENYQGSVKPSIEKLTIRVVTTLESVVTELRQGEIHGAWPSNPVFEDLAPLDEDPNLQYESYAGSTWSHIDINLNNPFLSDVALRQAFFTAIDIGDITEKNYPEVEVPWKGNHFFSEGGPYYVDLLGETTQGTGDPDAARQILEEAGYTWNGEDKLLTPDGEQVTFSFRFVGVDTIRTTIAELVQSYVAQIGIDLELVPLQEDELGASLEGGDYDTVIFGWVGSPAFTTNPSQYFHSESGSNFGRWEDQDVDAEIEAVTTTIDLEEAAAHANTVSEAAIAHAYTLPLYDTPQAIAWNSAVVENIVVNGYSQSGPLWNVREWTGA